jgi:hypothetical protein
LETFSDPSESWLKKIVDSMATNFRNRFLKFLSWTCPEGFCRGSPNAEKKIQNKQIAVEFVTDEQKI